MAFIGDAALSKLLDLLLGKSIDAALNFVADHKQVYDQLKEWKSILPDIKAVLNHAEEKQIKDEGVKNWLEDLQDLTYDADDILDDFAYEELRLKLHKAQVQASTSKVRKFLPTCCTGSDFTPSSFLFKNAMIPKMKEITARLNSLATRRNSLGLSEILPQAVSSERKKLARLQPTSVVDGAVEYIGRDNEKQEMLDLLKTNNSDAVCVLSIVGMGGMGKTTLAQLVYNDPSIEESFDHKAWISNKEKSRFVMHDLMNDLAQSVAGDICCRLEDNKQHMFSHRSRHSSNNTSDNGTAKMFEAFGQINSLRTFLRLKEAHLRIYLSNVVLVELLPRHGYLRVLSLCGYGITELPEFFENLNHLRYLNLSHNGIKCLSDSLCNLYQLETLLLEGCSKLQEFPPKMENLVSLHYIDIRGVDSIERMPLGIGNLTNLRRLSDVVIGEGDGHRIAELKNLSNLRGDFCLSRDFEKPIRKNEVEERVLNSLHPHKKLEKLVIENYGGVKFSTWISDSSLSNLSSLKLHDCKNCKSLPPIGRLPLLKDLSICDLDEVHKIGVELFGENQSIAFASLETLSFGNLPNWEEWDPCEADGQISRFPGLRKLSISLCPQLLGRLPTRLQSLQRLEILFCRKLGVSISSFPSLHELIVDGCEELVDGCSSSPVEEVTSLQSMYLSNISNFSIPAERIMSRFANSKDFRTGDFNILQKVSHTLTFLTRMVLINCEGLISFAEGNLPLTMKELRICDCNSLQYLFGEGMSSNTCLLENLDISRCQSLIWLSSRGATCNRLQNLRIEGCPKLSSLFLNAKLPVMLKKLDIWGCRVLECIAQDFDETTDLEIIKIRGAQNIKSLPRRLDKLRHLQEISLYDCSNLAVCFEEIGMPTTNLREFSMDGCKNLGGLPKCLNNFTSLGSLMVWNCGADISFPEDGFPTNLTSLSIRGASRIYSSLVGWGFHRLTSLQRLNVGCLDVVSFPDERIGLPPSLTSIGISDCNNLEFMCSKGFQHLTSLEALFIENCPKLTSLPEKGMLLSLGLLYLRNCTQTTGVVLKKSHEDIQLICFRMINCELSTTLDMKLPFGHKLM
ncbi:hypothetical protein V6N13_117349 [Hibiscus sabdariffa]